MLSFCTFTVAMLLSSTDLSQMACDKFAEVKVVEEPKVKLASLDAAYMPPPKPPVAKPMGDSHLVAVYNIHRHTVRMPTGEVLEAHSGLDYGLDNPRYSKVRMRGPTPPNVYDLTLRESLFHGVRAIRLNPVDEDKMHGRAGMLAHPYMMGPDGASNGCVSLRDYDKFLRAFLKGKVKKLVVVAGE